MVKSPKIYFVEPGLACWLLGIESAKEVARDPLHGNLFENMVVVEALKARLNQGKEPQLYCWQDSNGNEVDLIFETQRRLVPIEVKSAMTWHKDFAKNVHKFQRTIADAELGYVVYAGDLCPGFSEGKAVNYQATATIFES